MEAGTAGGAEDQTDTGGDGVKSPFPLQCKVSCHGQYERTGVCLGLVVNDPTMYAFVLIRPDYAAALGCEVQRFDLSEYEIVFPTIFLPHDIMEKMK